MLRSRRFHRWMARLALAAILLVATLPTLGRMLESRAPVLQDAMLAMCTGDGLVLKAHDLLHGDGQSPAGATHDGDCAYCPLLAAMVPMLLAALLLLPLRAAARVFPLRASPLRRAFVPDGLGARGPPILL